MELKKLLTTDWHQCLPQLGAMIIHWKAVVSPFYSKLGKLVTLGEAKAEARVLLDKYTELAESSDPFTLLLSDFERNHECYGVIHQHWSTLDSNDKSVVNQVVSSAVENASRKVNKDVKRILELEGDHHTIIPTTNRRCESSFSLLKVSFEYFIIRFIRTFYLLSHKLHHGGMVIIRA